MTKRKSLIDSVARALKPCPWCGKQPDILGGRIYCNNDDCRVVCSSFGNGVRWPGHGSNHAQNVKAWNTRFDRRQGKRRK